MIPADKEIALGQQTLIQIEKLQGGTGAGSLTCTNPEGLAALKKMSDRLAAQADIPYPLNLRVFRSDVLNAFAVPGGQIVLFDGLLQAAGSPEEVAGVLGHEIGHVVRRDPIRLTLRSAGSIGILGLLFGDFAGGAVILIVTERLIQASYSQEAEAAADLFATSILADAGLPSAPLGNFFDTLMTRYGQRTGMMTHLASHPDLAARKAAALAADTIGDGPFTPVLEAGEWAALKRICATRRVKSGKGIINR
jgi:Zn-dependent protease with chaperone function